MKVPWVTISIVSSKIFCETGALRNSPYCFACLVSNLDFLNFSKSNFWSNFQEQARPKFPRVPRVRH